MAAFEDLSLQERMLRTFEAEEFLSYEASLLDERRFNEWLDLLTDACRWGEPGPRIRRPARGAW
ncbi:MAG: hypothetical protein P8Y69_18610 [Gammaproteobacteria bacterium]